MAQIRHTSPAPSGKLADHNRLASRLTRTDVSSKYVLRHFWVRYHMPQNRKLMSFWWHPSQVILESSFFKRRKKKFGESQLLRVYNIGELDADVAKG